MNARLRRGAHCFVCSGVCTQMSFFEVACGMAAIICAFAYLLQTVDIDVGCDPFLRLKCTRRDRDEDKEDRRSTKNRRTGED